jgi:hypothetical protein
VCYTMSVTHWRHFPQTPIPLPRPPQHSSIQDTGALCNEGGLCGVS